MKRAFFILLLVSASCLGIAAQTAVNNCPEISVAGPSGVTSAGELMTFAATVTNYNPADKLEYEWTVTAGTIERGQGTSSIDVMTTLKMSGSRVDASVKISGIPAGCLNSASDAGQIAPHFPNEKVDQIGKKRKADILPRMDNFFIFIARSPGCEGVMVVRFNKKESRAQKTRYLNDLYDSIIFIKKDPSLVTFIISEDEGETMTTLWIAWQDQVLDYVASDSIVIKGEEFKQKVKTLFKK